MFLHFYKTKNFYIKRVCVKIIKISLKRKYFKKYTYDIWLTRISYNNFTLLVLSNMPNTQAQE